MLSINNSGPISEARETSVTASSSIELDVAAILAEHDSSLDNADEQTRAPPSSSSSISNFDRLRQKVKEYHSHHNRITDHQQQKEQQTLAAVHAMGGMSSVLNAYFSHFSEERECLMSEQQVRRLMSVLEMEEEEEVEAGDQQPQTQTTEIEMKAMDINEEQKDNNNNHIPLASLSSVATFIYNDFNRDLRERNAQTIKDQNKTFKLVLNVNNDFWHLLIPNKYSHIADRISAFTVSYKMIVAIVAVLFVYAISGIIQFGTSVMYQCVMGAMLFCMLFTANVSMTTHMLFTFDFWFKSGKMIQFILSLTVIVYSPWLTVTVIPRILSSTIAITLICLLDAYRIRFLPKVALLFGTFLFFAGAYIAWYMDSSDAYEKMVTVFGYSLSMRSSVLSSLFTLTLFIGKQAVGTLMSHNRAVMVSIAPEIVWMTERIQQ